MRIAALVAALLVAGSAAAATPRVRAYEVGYATYYRLSTTDAEALAQVCARDLERCGDVLVGDGVAFADDCDASGAAVAAQIRAAARDARAHDAGWGVVTRTENGGYPFACTFAASPPPPPDLCPLGRISRQELAALPPLERAIALAERFFCVGPGWSPALPR
jgi:hypothetical protein